MASQHAQGTGFFLPQTFRVVPRKQLPETRCAHQPGKKSQSCKAAAMARQGRRQTRSRAARGKGHGAYSTHRKEARDEDTSSHGKMCMHQAMPSNAASSQCPAGDGDLRDFDNSCDLPSGLGPHDSSPSTDSTGIATYVKTVQYQSESTNCSWVDASQLLSPAATPKSSSSNSSLQSSLHHSSSLNDTPRAAPDNEPCDRSSFARLVEKLHRQASAAGRNGSCGTSSSHSGREHQSTLHVPSSTWPQYQHPGVMYCPPSEGPAW
jgi:hypothetical protein